MSALLIAFGVGFIPIGLFALVLLASVERGGRRDALRHPIRTISRAIESNE